MPIQHYSIFYEPSTDVLISAVALPGTSVPVTELYSSVPSLVIWGLPGNSGSAQGCFSAQPQADQAEFTINVSSSNTDSYQISNVVCPSGPPASLPFPAPFRRLSQKKTCHHAHM